MKFYGKKFIRNNVDRRVRKKLPDRDAIVWSINEAIGADWFAMVKIQGSSTEIKARYPQGHRYRPEWLRPGCPVVVRFPRGNRGYLEIVSVGRSIPTAIEGGDTPDLATADDSVMTGMAVTETDPPSMAVAVESGTYRIDGVTYVFDAEVTSAIVMNDPPPMIMDDPPQYTMGEGQYVVSVDAAPASGYGRYDILVIGTDGVVDYIAGTPRLVTDAPDIPTTPVDHLRIAVLFIYGGLTELDNASIGAEWEAPKPATTTVTFSSYTGDIIEDEYGAYYMVWEVGNDYPLCNINVSVYDQYDQLYDLSTNCTVEIVFGTGTVNTLEGGTFGTSTTKLNFRDDYSFFYKRDQLAEEYNPTFEITFSGYTILKTYIMLSLLPEE